MFADVGAAKQLNEKGILQPWSYSHWFEDVEQYHSGFCNSSLVCGLYIHVFAKLRKVNTSFIVSVRMGKLCSQWTDFY